MGLIPVRVGVPGGSKDGVPVFVVELTDAVQPSLYATLREAERSYREHLRKWSDLVRKARAQRGDPVPRLELGADLDSYFDKLERNSQLRVTNKEQALTTQLGLSRADLDYIRRASRQFSIDDVRRYHVNWSQIMALTGIRSPTKLREGLELVAGARLKSQDDLRAFRREANRVAR